MVRRQTGLFSRAAGTASGRYGIALGTWNFNGVSCYDLNGNKYPSCANSPVKFYINNFNDMQVTAYDGSNHALAPAAFNIAPFDRLDPAANTQFIWFHYEDNNGNTLLPGNSYLTTDQMTNPNPLYGARIYATSGAPGSIQVRVIKGPTSDIQYPLGTVIPANYKLRLPAAAYTNGVVNRDANGYPMCTGCIFREADFHNFLEQNKYWTDNGTSTGNWYGFYILAETEYKIVSHYLTPQEYAAVFNEYVAKLNSWYPGKARFIFMSPAGNDVSKFKPYFDALIPLLTPQARAAITFMGLDPFYGPPQYPDFAMNGYPAVTDAQLQSMANNFVSGVSTAGNYLYSVSGGKYVVLTQTGTWLPNPYPSSNCGWCANDTDVWRTTQYGQARLTQLVFRNLERNNVATKVVAWAYWGNVQQPTWYEPLVGLQWGGVRHGISWLTWPIYCTAAANCSANTSKPWPSYSGMVYLKMANGNKTYRPDNAPGWWPWNEVY